MIVKVQISQNTNAAERQVLVYDLEYQYYAELPLSACPGLRETMLDTAPVWRAFFEAEIVDTKLSLGRRLPDQEW
jgi:hypothetical protein